MNKRNHILVVSPEFYTHTNWGGIASYYNYVTKLLVNDGNFVSIATLKDKCEGKKSINQDKLDIYLVSADTQKMLEMPFFHRFSLIAFWVVWNFKILFLVNQLHKKKPVDLIITPLYQMPFFLGAVLSLYKIPILINSHGEYFSFQKIILKNTSTVFFNFIEFITVRYLNIRITFCSDNLHSKANNHFSKHRSQFSTLSNPLLLDYPLNKESHHFNKNVLVYFGRLEYRKGVDVLVESFLQLYKKNDALKLVLIGEKGSGFFIKEKNENLSFDEWMKKKNINNENIQFFKRIDNKIKLFKKIEDFGGIVVLPSRYEPFGYTALESLYLGQITIGSSEGGNEEFIKHKINGYISRPDVASLVELIQNIQNQTKHTIFLMKNKAFKTSRKILSKNNNQFLKVYKEVIASSKLSAK